MVIRSLDEPIDTDPRRLVASLARGVTSDPNVLAVIDDWCGIPPRRAGARRRGLASYRRLRPVAPPKRMATREVDAR